MAGNSPVAYGRYSAWFRLSETQNSDKPFTSDEFHLCDIVFCDHKSEGRNRNNAKNRYLLTKKGRSFVISWKIQQFGSFSKIKLKRNWNDVVYDQGYPRAERRRQCAEKWRESPWRPAAASPGAGGLLSRWVGTTGTGREGVCSLRFHYKACFILYFYFFNKLLLYIFRLLWSSRYFDFLVTCISCT